MNNRVDAVRRFNRFYTRRLGLLKPAYLDSRLSLTQVRVLYELAHREGLTAKDLIEELSLDAGYLSRVLAAYTARGWIRGMPSPEDGRQRRLAMTAKGRAAFAPLQARSQREIAALLDPLSDADQARLVGAMQTMEAVLSAQRDAKTAYVLRPHQPGDIGWVVHRHGVLYSREYGWDETFEALVAEIAARFVKDFDPKRERCWIAERDGEILGCVFLVRRPGQARTCQLRMLLVEPSARGMGIGNRLVEECLRFARQVGYRKMVLWTNSVLTAARNIYKKAGFRMTESEKHHSWGHDLVSETWELKL
jgi:DNA-binding MarR family transcriptional regulator/N-acetylglutamate synthase-like GNAT family acetyltransferase